MDQDETQQETQQSDIQATLSVGGTNLQVNGGFKAPSAVYRVIRKFAPRHSEETPRPMYVCVESGHLSWSADASQALKFHDRDSASAFTALHSGACEGADVIDHIEI